ncbi:DUF968 domain-containing protein [Phytobacter sp. V91]|uniref:DUF968 domain-containing protein n=1 Tax=Phytobacter sp. V91 TaxID=3369425 RepID=UPI003F5F3038
MTRALLKPDIAREMGVVLLRPGRELMHIFMSGRVLVESQPANMAELPSGAVPPARQPLSEDPSLISFFTHQQVVKAAGGINGLENWLLHRGSACQWPHSAYHHKEFVTLRHAGSAVCLCWHCDNQLRDAASQELDPIAAKNAAAWILRAIRGELRLPDDHEVTLPELCWWAVLRGVFSAISEFTARRAMGMPEVEPQSVMRECDIVPSLPATSILSEKVAKAALPKPASRKAVVSVKVDPVAPQTLFSRPKRIRWENPKFLAWVKSQPCACCGQPADDSHHLIGWGQGGMATKSHDAFTIPLCRKHHTELHNNPAAFERQYGTQPELIIKLLDRAFALGVLA